MTLGSGNPLEINPTVTADYAKFVPIYDRVNAIASMGTGLRYRKDRLRKLEPSVGEAILDLGCGTGRIAIAAQEMVGPTGRVVGVDPCPEMLERAKALGLRETCAGSLEDLPFQDRTFDVVTCGYAIRYAENLERTLSEIRRILRPGGRLLLLEMFWPEGAFPRLLVAGYVRGLAKVTSLVGSGSRRSNAMLDHLWHAVDAAAGPKEIVSTLERVGFVDVDFDMTGCFLGEITGRVDS